MNLNLREKSQKSLNKEPKFKNPKLAQFWKNKIWANRVFNGLSKYKICNLTICWFGNFEKVFNYKLWVASLSEFLEISLFKCNLNICPNISMHECHDNKVKHVYYTLGCYKLYPPYKNIVPRFLGFRKEHGVLRS